MERKELIGGLRLIRKAINEKEQKLNEKYQYYWYDSDYEKHMEQVPTCPKEPSKPKEPRVPSNEKDRFLKEESTPSFDEYREKNYSKPKFEFSGRKLRSAIVGAIIGGLIILIGLMVLGEGNLDLKNAHKWYNSIANQDQLYSEYMNKINVANRGIDAGVTTIIVGGCVALIFAIISLATAFVSYKTNVKNAEEALKNSYQNNVIIIDKANKEKAKRRFLATNDYENYERSLALYREKLKEYEKESEAYNIEFEKYQKEYNAQLQLAKNKVETHNMSIESVAEENFEKSMSAVNVEFPEKYYYAIDKIINILEDFRADSLKEAINVLKEDEHKENMLNEQRRLIDLQEEYNAELERQGEENARYQQEQNDLQRARIREEERQHKEMLSFQREQARQQQEQERIRYENQLAYQREQERHQRDAERQEQERIKRIRSGCAMCANRFTCSIKNSITSACPRFISK